MLSGITSGWQTGWKRTHGAAVTGLRCVISGFTMSTDSKPCRLDNQLIVSVRTCQDCADGEPADGECNRLKKKIDVLLLCRQCYPRQHHQPSNRENVNTTMLYLQRDVYLNIMYLTEYNRLPCVKSRSLLQPGSFAFSCFSNFEPHCFIPPFPPSPQVSLGLKAETWPINTTAGSPNPVGGGGERRREGEISRRYTVTYIRFHTAD